MDCTFNTGLGNFNFLVGIIITDGRRILMAKNPNDKREYLEWIDLDNSEGVTVYPEFFRTVDFENDREIRHFVSKE
ncbi:hypothetical protein [Ruminococcus sp.]|uniref:hypothetical protein n=1 Tax=Ruminococcus sp. TaxID=41978 RepID=UPI002E75BD08|nr:hypothetical protein [Ruminococcus sp.]MEE1262275.1 hypothetical protein [Ruminococcus sp.]